MAIHNGPRGDILKTEDGGDERGIEESQRSCDELILLFAPFIQNQP